MTVISGETNVTHLNTIEQRPRIISVTLRSHIGEPKEQPFSIKPSQLASRFDMSCEIHVGLSLMDNSYQLLNDNMNDNNHEISNMN